MDTIYIDSLFFLNCIIDYLLLLSAGRICTLPLRRSRMALSAMVGGLYAAAAVLWPEIFALLPCKLLSGVALVLLAFGRKDHPVRAVAVFFAVSAAFGGAVCAAGSLAGQRTAAGVFVPVSMRVLVLSFALSYAALTLVFRRSGQRADREIRQVSVRLAEQTVSFPALRDTGNELIDPTGGRRVLIAEADVLAPLLPEELRPLLRGDPLESFQRLSADPLLRGRLHLLSCRCVTAPAALLLCFRPDSFTLDGSREDRCVAVTANPLSPDGAYHAVL